MAWYQGPCRITVTAVAADFPQRAVVTLSGGATVVIPGTAGESRLIDAAGFHLALEHEHGGTWRPNIRALQSRWTYVEGGRSQVIRSKDVDWPGDRAERNFVLRVDRLDGEQEAPGTPMARRAVTESTDARRTETGVPTSSAMRTTSGHGADPGFGVPAPRTTTSGEGAGVPRTTTSGRDHSSFG
ncbi:hypothetical protein [Streptomyces sp.]|uniref:hypothetical protein n=1 Tax=Streptomyces sp. TaxID=1931 RepID=UPI002F400D94